MSINIERINSKLEGEFTFRGKKWSVPFTLVGDAVQFKLKRRGRKLSLEVLHIEKDEKNRANPHLTRHFCSYFGKCGGCRGQHLSYEYQLALKTDPIITAMHDKFHIKPEIIPAHKLKGHRHRMDFTVNGNSVGLHPAGNFSDIIDIDECPVQSENANLTLNLMREALKIFPEAGYSRENLSGIIKYATIRWGKTGSLILTCDAKNISEDEYILSMKKFTEYLIEKIENMFGNNLSLVYCTSSHGSEVSCTSEGTSLYGTDSFQIELGGRDFNIPYDSFFQPNPGSFNGLIEWSLNNMTPEFYDDGSCEFLDFYSGAGILSSIFSDRLKQKTGFTFTKIRGYDFISSSIEGAKNNFTNFIGEVEFNAVDLNKTFPGEQNPFRGNVALILADPPRAGLSPALIKNILEHSDAPLFLYISCNPESQIRDLQLLEEKYRIAGACIADCFPHTGHLEQAVIMKHKNHC